MFDRVLNTPMNSESELFIRLYLGSLSSLSTIFCKAYACWRLLFSLMWKLCVLPLFYILLHKTKMFLKLHLKNKIFWIFIPADIKTLSQGCHNFRWFCCVNVISTLVIKFSPTSVSKFVVTLKIEVLAALRQRTTNTVTTS